MLVSTSKMNPLHDPSFWLLLFSNVITIFLAVTQGWGLLILMWIYWFQSLTIGVFNFLRMRQFKNLKTEIIYVEEKQVELIEQTAHKIAWSFLLSYTFMHLMYLVFLLAFSLTENIEISAIFGGPLYLADAKYIIITASMFFVSHIFSYFYNKANEFNKSKLTYLMHIAYMRVLPMHLTIIFTMLIKEGLLFFLLLKTVSDLTMHNKAHANQNGDE